MPPVGALTTGFRSNEEPHSSRNVRMRDQRLHGTFEFLLLRGNRDGDGVDRRASAESLDRAHQQRLSTTFDAPRDRKTEAGTAPVDLEGTQH